MEQYWSTKAAHPDKIMLFRMGDFFEMFYEDAQTAAPLLGIALTARNKKSGDQTPMCGVPHHSIGGHISTLLGHGLKVAICDQVEEASQAKGLVRREVTRILSPGMVYNPDDLSMDRPNYLAAYSDNLLAFLEPTTGECFFYPVKTWAETLELIKTLAPAELVVSENQNQLKDSTFLVSVHETNLNAADVESLMGEDSSKSPSSPALRLLSYCKAMQGGDVLLVLRPFEKRTCEFRLQLGENTLRHLEVFNSYKGGRDGTLYWAINRTKTAGGARLLRQWLQFPLGSKEKIIARQDEIQKWMASLEPLKALRKDLAAIGDLERRLGKVSQPQCHPRDLQSLGLALEGGLKVLPFTAINDSGVIDDIQDLVGAIEQTLREEMPNNYRDGAFINKGVHTVLDEFIDIAANSQKKITELEAAERERTGIPSLKVRYNNVFGFYIEVTNTHKAKVPKERYMRKQTLTNAERYVTDELNELEKKVLTAKSKRNELELEIFAGLKAHVLKKVSSLLTLAQGVNRLDVLTSLAWLSLENSYSRPEIIEAGTLVLEGCRHPVVEQCLTTSAFVPNDISVEPHQCLLLTGPNMAGKSTVMRQVAVAVILGQMGSFVPARKARLPLVDKIFTRIGASDFLTEGLSTFMVEMQETAEMLKQSTAQSLVILDEVGRGTSTYDGMSLAQAILEHFVSQICPMTLFATHYHEMTSLSEAYPQKVVNFHMSIADGGGGLKFLYQLAPGPATKSYGIQVADLAGIPKKVVRHAEKILQQLEKKATSVGGTPQLDLFSGALSAMEPEPEAVETLPSPFEKDIRDLEIHKMTPLDALNKISQWQKDLI